MRKLNALIFASIFSLASCMTVKEVPSDMKGAAYGVPDDGITQSLFDDKNATISEENLQTILEGYAFLPEKLRVAVVNIENVRNVQPANRYYNHMWNDEDYISSRQKYLSVMTDNLQQQDRVKKVALIPDMMIPPSPSFTSIREAAVRMQADVVVVYSIRGGLYSKYKLFSSDEYKAFATTQVMIMDVRTGLVPFTTVVTEEYNSKKQKSDFNDTEAIKRVREEAVSLTLKKVCEDMNVFLSKEEGEE
ncbi:MAG: hypothetical protein ACK5KT_01570 [Dysgonomonas sp.]